MQYLGRKGNSGGEKPARRPSCVRAFATPTIPSVLSFSHAAGGPMALPKLRSPIVLVHGLLGFGEVRLRGVTVSEYFPGVSRALRAAGNRVLIPNLSPTGGVADRAAQLKAFIDRESPHEPVHLLAHSMGGLDSRYLASKLGTERRVLT